MSAFTDEDGEIYPDEEVPTLPVPTGGEDWDGAADAKSGANEAKASSNFDLAVEKFTKAMELGGASAMTLASRAECLLKLRRPLAALSDCDEALKMNPDSAKALRCRGTVCRHMGRWEESNKNLAAAQAIDFLPELEELRVFVNTKAVAIEAERVKQRIMDEEALREKVKKQREEIAKAKKEQEERDKAEAEEAAGRGGFPGGFPGGMPGGMPGGFPGGMPGGMPGMGGDAGGGMQQMLMQMLMSDPELAAGLQNPKIINAFTSMMGGGGSSPPDLSDPEVAAFMTKLQDKLGPLMGMMGGMGGMPGGMPGGMGGFGEEMGEEDGNDSDDDMPDLEEQDAPRPQVEEVD